MAFVPCRECTWLSIIYKLGKYIVKVTHLQAEASHEDIAYVAYKDQAYKHPEDLEVPSLASSAYKYNTFSSSIENKDRSQRPEQGTHKEDTHRHNHEQQPAPQNLPRTREAALEVGWAVACCVAAGVVVGVGETGRAVNNVCRCTARQRLQFFFLTRQIR